MSALKELFSTDVGLLSVATLGIILGMAAFYVWYFVKHVREDTARHERAVRRP